jgi:hypothetical protein
VITTGQSGWFDGEVAGFDLGTFSPYPFTVNTGCDGPPLAFTEVMVGLTREDAVDAVATRTNEEAATAVNATAGHRRLFMRPPLKIE